MHQTGSTVPTLESVGNYPKYSSVLKEDIYCDHDADQAKKGLVKCVQTYFQNCLQNAMLLLLL